MTPIHVPTPAHLPAAAQEFLRQVGSRPRVVAFYGAMGAGKTTFIRALCEALGTHDAINSPTFALVNEYATDATTSGLIYHFDFYRIRTLDEALAIGTEDYFESPTWCFIEWPERIESLLPPDAIRVRIAEQPDGSRTITIEQSVGND